ncbi:MAG: amidohydrolase [Streptosporangiaceae bacterium]
MRGARQSSGACGSHDLVAHLIDPDGVVDLSGGEDAAGSGGQDRRAADAPADLLFVGRVVTMDESRPEAGAVAVRHGRVAGVGSVDDLADLIGPQTTRVDLGDAVLYPGFIEPHMHVWVTGIIYRWLDCGAMTHHTVGDVLDSIAAEAGRARPGEWVRGSLFDPSMYRGYTELTRDQLDAVAPGNPVLVLNASMHYAYVNTQALRRAGIDDNAASPPGGHYGRDSSGRLNGVLGEIGAIMPMLRLGGTMSPMDLQHNIHAITVDAAAVGVTAMCEAATGAILGRREIDLLHALSRQGRLKTRLSLAVLDELADQWPDVRPGAGGDMVWIGARKIIADGSNQGRSGYQHEPYLGTRDRGAPDISQADLTERIAWCEQNDWQLMVHANGDAAVDMTVGAYRQALAGRRRKDLRHRIEHCSLAGNGVFTEMAAVGVSPSFLINHVYFWGQTLRDNLLGAKRADLLDRAASAMAAGLRFTMHSDYNVSPIKPLLYVWIAVTRQMRGGGTLNEAEKVPVYQALRAVTIDAAWQIHADDVMGSITPGKYADFVVLDQDPQRVPAERIRQIQVRQTWLGGRPTYHAASAWLPGPRSPAAVRRVAGGLRRPRRRPGRPQWSGHRERRPGGWTRRSVPRPAAAGPAGRRDHPRSRRPLPMDDMRVWSAIRPLRVRKHE